MWMVKDLSSLKTAFGVVCGIWCFVAFLAIMGNVAIHNSGHDPFAAPTPVSHMYVHRNVTKIRVPSQSQYWCWIHSTQFWWRIFAVYTWIWLSLFFSLLLYALLYLWMRGNITIDERKWWKFKFTFRRTNKSDPAFRTLRRRSSIMLAWVVPLAFILVLTK